MRMQMHTHTHLSSLVLIQAHHLPWDMSTHMATGRWISNYKPRNFDLMGHVMGGKPTTIAWLARGSLASITSRAPAIKYTHTYTHKHAYVHKKYTHYVCIHMCIQLSGNTHIHIIITTHIILIYSHLIINPNTYTSISEVNFNNNFWNVLINSPNTRWVDQRAKTLNNLIGIIILW